jgi:hypothetical protein
VLDLAEEVGSLQSTDATVAVAAVIATNTARPGEQMKGARFLLENNVGADFVYLDETELDSLLADLADIQGGLPGLKAPSTAVADAGHGQLLDAGKTPPRPLSELPRGPGRVGIRRDTPRNRRLSDSHRHPEQEQAAVCARDPRQDAGGRNVITKISTLVPTERVPRRRCPSAEKLGLVQEPRRSWPSPKVTRTGLLPSAFAT